MRNILLAILVTRSAGAGDGAAMMYWAERSARRVWKRIDLGAIAEELKIAR